MRQVVICRTGEGLIIDFSPEAGQPTRFKKISEAASLALVGPHPDRVDWPAAIWLGKMEEEGLYVEDNCLKYN